MNRKNFLLIILACLNCVYTTHAVEKPMGIQKVDSEDMDKLRVLWALHERRCGDFRDIAIANDIAIAKDALLEGLRDIINCLHSLPETVLTKNHCRGVTKMLQDKTKELCETGKITDPMMGYKYNDNNKIEYFHASMDESRSYYHSTPYTDLLRTGYPDLAQYFDVAYHKLLPQRLNLWHLLQSSDIWVMQATEFDARIDGLGTKYPDIAKQIVDWEKMILKRNLIRRIKYSSIDVQRQHLRQFRERLGASNSKITQEAWNTILNTIHHCLIGEDQDLKERAQILWQEIEKIESKIGRMTLAKIVKPRGNISDHLKKCVLKSVVKYV